jgi:osmotically-inducible protein OsmY
MSDKSLRQAVIDELDCEPRVDATHIGVAVEDGVVTLTGHVESYASKNAAEEAVKRVLGVKAIAQDIQVRMPGDKKSADDQIAKRAFDIIAWNCWIPENKVKVTIQNGHVTLSGDVDWHYRRDNAEDAVRKLSGIKGVTNTIQIKPSAKATNVKQRIENALKRSAEVEADAVTVSVFDGRVTLSGKVKTFFERGLVERTAWMAPGVVAVNDQITVG